MATKSLINDLKGLIKRIKNIRDDYNKDDADALRKWTTDHQGWLSQRIGEALDETEGKILQDTCGTIVLRILGSGTTGIVYETKDKQALKVYKQADGILGELTVLSGIRHPHLLYSTGIVLDEKCSRTGLVLPLMAGSLNDLELKATWEERVHLFYQMASAVNALHANNIIHADIKPNNITYTGANNQPHLYLGDFGHSVFTPNVNVGTTVDYVLTTKLYCPYEFLDEKGPVRYTGAVDIWSLGQLAMYIFTEDVLYSRTDPDVKKWTREALIPTKIDETINEWFDDFYDDYDLDGKNEEQYIQFKDLIGSMLRLDPVIRPKIGDVLAHPLFKDHKPIPWSLVPLPINPINKYIRLIVDQITIIASLYNISDFYVVEAINLVYRAGDLDYVHPGDIILPYRAVDIATITLLCVLDVHHVDNNVSVWYNALNERKLSVSGLREKIIRKVAGQIVRSSIVTQYADFIPLIEMARDKPEQYATMVPSL